MPRAGAVFVCHMNHAEALEIGQRLAPVHREPGDPMIFMGPMRDVVSDASRGLLRWDAEKRLHVGFVVGGDGPDRFDIQAVNLALPPGAGEIDAPEMREWARRRERVNAVYLDGRSRRAFVDYDPAGP